METPKVLSLAIKGGRTTFHRFVELETFVELPPTTTSASQTTPLTSLLLMQMSKRQMIQIYKL